MPLYLVVLTDHCSLDADDPDSRRILNFEFIAQLPNRRNGKCRYRSGDGSLEASVADFETALEQLSDFDWQSRPSGCAGALFVVEEDGDSDYRIVSGRVARSLGLDGERARQIAAYASRRRLRSHVA